MDPGHLRALTTEECAGDPRRVAPGLIGAILCASSPRGLIAGVIVEVEAYLGSLDPASHAYRGRTPRNQVMFGRPGLLYVYFTYGMHYCANVVSGVEGDAGAILIRALRPVAGLEIMASRRPAARRERDLTSGPAKVCQALGIGPSHNGADLLTGDRGVWLARDPGASPPALSKGSRIGISSARDHQWRWWDQDDPNVSAGRVGIPAAPPTQPTTGKFSAGRVDDR